MIWEIYQQSKIAGAEQTADRAMSKAERHSSDLVEIRRQMDRLSLACQAMWELFRERTDLTEADLKARILEIDGRDGKIDGKIATKLTDCPSCGRPTNSKRGSCVMCGAPLQRDHPFEV